MTTVGEDSRSVDGARSAGTRPPGPPQRLLTGSFREFRRDVLGFLRHIAREYGDMAWFRLARKECILLSHPDLIEAVLVKHNKQVKKHFAVQLARGVLGNGLLTSEGSFWLRQRRMAAPAFHADRIANYGPDMVSAAERMLASWKDGETRDIHADMMKLTLDIVAQTLFGADVGGDAEAVERALVAALRSFANRINSVLPLPHWVPTPTNLRYRRAVRTLDEVVRHLIEKRRADTRQRNDLMSLLLHARDEDDGTAMTDEQLADEARTFLLAGHETTALSLSWAWYLLGTNPQKQQKLCEELQAVVGDRAPAVSDLPRLRYAEWVILESMRLYPPAFVVGREATSDFELGGYTIPRGTTLFMSQWVMHRDGRYFERPDAFEPERWSGERQVPKGAYFPFGGGPRICIGNTFAMQESVLVLATIARQWSFRVVPEHEVVPVPLFTLRPRDGILVVVSRRGAKPSG